MALIQCPECGKEISDLSNSCIHCGFVLKKVDVNALKTIKKVNRKVIISICIIILLFIGIGGVIGYEKLTIPLNKYKLACVTLNNGEYDSAIKMFAELEGYKDSFIKIKESYYLKGMNLYQNKEYENAIEALNNAGNYQDAVSQITNINKRIEEENAKVEAEAKHHSLLEKMKKAQKGCIGGRSKLSSDGTELIVDGKDSDDVFSVLDIHGVIATLGLPNTLYDEMARTTSLMGKQSRTYDDYEVSWSYHPSNGLDAYFKIIN